MNQKQSWKEKLRKNYSTPDGKVDCTTNKMELFIEILIQEAIQTRERELREEWQKLETISKEVEIDNLAMQYELGREDREREISELIEKTIQEERFAGAPYALNRVLGIINNKSL